MSQVRQKFACLVGLTWEATVLPWTGWIADGSKHVLVPAGL